MFLLSFVVSLVAYFSTRNFETVAFSGSVPRLPFLLLVVGLRLGRHISKQNRAAKRRKLCQKLWDITSDYVQAK